MSVGVPSSLQNMLPLSENIDCRTYHANGRQDYPHVGYLWLCGLMSPASFTEHVVKVFFSPDFTDAEYIIVLSGFFWLFKLLSVTLSDQQLSPDVQRARLEAESFNCREYLETALAALPFNLPTTYSFALALGYAVRVV